MNIYLTSLQGKRKENEDTHTCILNLKNDNKKIAKMNLYQVCDGHNGDFVSKYLKVKLPPILTSNEFKHPLDDNKIKLIYQKINDQLKNKYYNDSVSCGSTCLVVLQYDNNELKIINTGDSRAIICNKQRIAEQLTKDHKVNSPDEIRRLNNINAADAITYDGYDWRIKDLSVSRVFGDFDNEFVVCTPDIYNYKINNDKFLILGCDGLYDNMTNQEIVDYICTYYYDDNYRFTNNENKNIAEELANYAINEKKTQDNVSIIIIIFE